MFQTYAVLNDYTDQKEWQMRARVFEGTNNHFGWYVYAGSERVVSDSQFSFTLHFTEVEDLKVRFNAYYAQELPKGKTK